MNVLFTDKLSATCWHHTAMNDKTKYLDNWLLRFFHGGWCDRDTDHPEGVPPSELWENQHGTLGVLCISVDVSSIDRDTGDLIAGEFNWAVYGVPVDNYGMAGDLDLYLTPNNRPIVDLYLTPNNRLIVGGLVNHGSDEDPSWSSHT